MADNIPSSDTCFPNIPTTPAKNKTRSYLYKIQRLPRFLSHPRHTAMTHRGCFHPMLWPDLLRCFQKARSHSRVRLPCSEIEFVQRVSVRYPRKLRSASGSSWLIKGNKKKGKAQSRRYQRQATRINCDYTRLVL